MQNIIRQDIEESLQWLRQQMAEHGFDTSTPVKDIEAFFQAQEATKDMLDNEISDIADEYGEDSLEVEAAEDLQNDVEEGFREVEENINKISQNMRNQNKDENVMNLLNEVVSQNKLLAKQLEEMQKDPLRIYREKVFNGITKVTSAAKNFADKTFGNIKQFCDDRKQDIFQAVDKARVKQVEFLKEFHLNVRDFVRENGIYCKQNQEKLSELAQAKAKYKAAKTNTLRHFFKPLLSKKQLEKGDIDLSSVTGEKSPAGKLAKAFAKEADMYQKMMERQDAKIAALDEKMASVTNKWQDKAKEPTQKSFEENLHRFEKEAEMENQNINPQRTQSQER